MAPPRARGLPVGGRRQDLDAKFTTDVDGVKVVGHRGGSGVLFTFRKSWISGDQIADPYAFRRRMYGVVHRGEKL
jgi:hypothetical protein